MTPHAGPHSVGCCFALEGAFQQFTSLVRQSRRRSWRGGSHAPHLSPKAVRAEHGPTLHATRRQQVSKRSRLFKHSPAWVIQSRALKHECFFQNRPPSLPIAKACHSLPLPSQLAARLPNTPRPYRRVLAPSPEYTNTTVSPTLLLLFSI